MIIAYKRPMNLSNLLSHRDLATGPPVLSYLYMIRDVGGPCLCVCVFSVCVCVCLVCVCVCVCV